MEVIRQRSDSGQRNSSCSSSASVKEAVVQGMAKQTQASSKRLFPAEHGSAVALHAKTTTVRF